MIHQGEILAASVAGPGVAVKALRASLAGKVRPSFDWTEPQQTYSKRNYLRLPESGMKCSKPHKLEFGLYHMTFVAKSPTLLHTRTTETLWQHLEKVTTTPMKRSWMEWVADTLLATKRLVEPEYQFGLSMAICTATDDVLDKIVMAAVSSGKVAI